MNNLFLILNQISGVVKYDTKFKKIYDMTDLIFFSQYLSCYLTPLKCRCDKNISNSAQINKLSLFLDFSKANHLNNKEPSVL